MEKTPPIVKKKSTRLELLGAFRLAVSRLDAGELADLNAWLERVTLVKPTTLDRTANAWLKIALGEILEPAAAGDRQLAPTGGTENGT